MSSTTKTLSKSKIPKSKSQDNQKAESKSTKRVKLNKARPAPDFGKIHKQWQAKLEDGLKKSKKPCTVPEQTIEHDGAASASPPSAPVVQSPDIGEPFLADPESLQAILNNGEVNVTNRTKRSATLYTSRQAVSSKKPLGEERRRRATGTSFVKSANKSHHQPAEVIRSTSAIVNPPIVPRFSIYDKARAAISQTARTPLRDLLNVVHSGEHKESEVATKTPKSIYKKTPATSRAVSDGDRLSVFCDDGLPLGITWSERFRRITAKAKQDEELKQRLVFDDDDDAAYSDSSRSTAAVTEELSQSILERLALAEKLIMDELSCGSHPPSSNTDPPPLVNNDTFTVCGSADGSAGHAVTGGSPDFVPSNRALAVWQTQRTADINYNTTTETMLTPGTDRSGRMLPVITGVSRLADTPIAPVLPDALASETYRVESSLTELMEEINLSGGDRSPAPSSVPVACGGRVTPPQPAACASSNLPAAATSTSAEVPREAVNGLTSPQYPPSAIEEQTTLTDAVHQLDRQLAKYRRRSAALSCRRQQSEVSGSDLQLQLDKILSYQQHLEAQKAEILRKLAESQGVQSAVLPIAAASTAVTANCLLPSSPSKAASELSIIHAAQGGSDNGGGAEDDDDSCSSKFLAEPAARLRFRKSLGLISTAVLEEKSSRGRPSINLMSFTSPPPTAGEVPSSSCLASSPTGQLSQRSMLSGTRGRSGVFCPAQPTTTIAATLSSQADEVILRLQSEHCLDSIKQRTSVSSYHGLSQMCVAASPLTTSVTQSVKTAVLSIHTPIARCLKGTIGIYSCDTSPVSASSSATKAVVAHHSTVSAVTLSTVFNATTASAFTSSNHVADSSRVAQRAILAEGVTSHQQPSTLRNACSEPNKRLDLSTPDVFTELKNKLASGRKQPVSDAAADRYRQALLDDEVTVCTYKLVVCCSPPAHKINEGHSCRQHLRNPVARCLTSGDEQHFIPISPCEDEEDNSRCGYCYFCYQTNRQASHPALHGPASSPLQLLLN